MVYLSRIYTRSGDQGETGLGDGTRVPKDHPRVAAYGTVDELNSVLGLLLARLLDKTRAGDDVQIIRSIQNDLLDVGGDLCLPQPEDEPPGKVQRVRAEQVTRLEQTIERFNDKLAPLRSFVLPGGTP